MKHVRNLEEKAHKQLMLTSHPFLRPTCVSLTGSYIFEGPQVSYSVGRTFKGMYTF